MKGGEAVWGEAEREVVRRCEVSCGYLEARERDQEESGGIQGLGVIEAGEE